MGQQEVWNYAMGRRPSDYGRSMGTGTAKKIVSAVNHPSLGRALKADVEAHPLDAGAARHTNQDEFPMMSMRRISKLPYVESMGEGYDSAHPQYSLVGAHSTQIAKAHKVYTPPAAQFQNSYSLDSKQSDIQDRPDYYGALKEHMRQAGPEGVAPIHVEPRGSQSSYGLGGEPLSHARLGNGGHRVAIAMELGWSHMRTTSGKQESGYDEEEDYGKDDDEDYTPHGRYQPTSYGGDHAPSSYGPGNTAPGPTLYHSGTTTYGEHGKWTKARGWPAGGEIAQAHARMNPEPESPKVQQSQTGQGQLSGMPPHFVGGGPTDTSNTVWRGAKEKMQNAHNANISPQQFGQ